MILYDLTTESLNAASEAIGANSITMVNLLWFRSEVQYDADVVDAKSTPVDALFDGYVPNFSRIADELGIDGIEPVLTGRRAAGLVASPVDDWDQIIAVRYRNFADFRAIVESEAYQRTAKPHHRAAVANWRIIAVLG